MSPNLRLATLRLARTPGFRDALPPMVDDPGPALNPFRLFCYPGWERASAQLAMAVRRAVGEVVTLDGAFDAYVKPLQREFNEFGASDTEASAALRAFAERELKRRAGKFASAQREPSRTGSPRRR